MLFAQNAEMSSIFVSKNNLKIDWATHQAAKYACENWHYSKCIPIGKLVKVGAWEYGKYIGCVIFSRGTAKHLGTKYGLKQDECVELTRVALTDHETPVSRILSIAIKFLKKSNSGIRLIVSFSAQSENHHGGIYQATNWIYAGQTPANSDAIYKGRRVPNRVIGEIKKKLNMNENELVAKGILSDVRKIPKHRYLFALDKEISKSIENLAQPYPKRAKKAMADSLSTAVVRHQPARSSFAP